VSKVRMQSLADAYIQERAAGGALNLEICSDDVWNALGSLSKLTRMTLDSSTLSVLACRQLAKVLAASSDTLEVFDITDCGLDPAMAEILVPALSTLTFLKKVYFTGSPTISAAGWGQLIGALRSCPLVTLKVKRCNLDEEKRRSIESCLQCFGPGLEVEWWP